MISRRITKGNNLIKQGNAIIDAGDASGASNLQENGKNLQQEGQALIDQALDKQDQLKKLILEQNQQRATYNQQIIQFNKLNKEIVALVTKINQQISNFNSCAKQYSN